MKYLGSSWLLVPPPLTAHVDRAIYYIFIHCYIVTVTEFNEIIL